jgi:hypothetical protein
MGCAVAALKIRHVGARSGLPGREEVQSLLYRLTETDLSSKSDTDKKFEHFYKFSLESDNRTNRLNWR